ncbi:MAG TPA: DUF2207 domain-containing protein [Thermoleophilia bacterium]|nr:DUF2207 domain-containing protein [Thermoleophilia bacterium]
MNGFLGRGERRRLAARVRRVLPALGVLLLVAAGAAGLAAGPAAAKDFSITSVSVDATVKRNGDVRITDTRTLDFSGDFHFVYWDLSARGSEGIDVLGASGPAWGDPGTTVPYEPSQFPSVGAWTGETGTYGIRDAGGVVTVQLNFNVTDATAAFTIEYVARGAARRWSDTAELYWQFIGQDVAVESRDVSVTVRLPQGVTDEQVRAWAHGPLWGTVTIQPDASVVMKVDPLPANTFVEGRILFPAAALSAASASSGPRLAAVLAEEQRLADEANRSRLWARLQAGLWGVLGVGVPLVALGLVMVLYFRYGREPRTQFDAQYLRDVPQPQLPPALAAFIWRMGSVGSDDVTATLLDLVNRKVIDLERVTIHEDRLFGPDETSTYKLTLRDERLSDLLEHERQLCTFLFHEIAGGDELVLSELKDLAKTQRTAFAQGFQTWKATVQEEGERRGYLDPHADRMAFIASAVAIVAIVAAGVAAVFSGFWWFLAGIPVGIVLIWVARAVKRRSQEAAELHAQYAALERYLKDFGRLDEKPPDAIVLWEQFLVFAVIFGIADEVAKAMTIKVPEVVSDPAFRTPYILWWGMPGEGGGLSAFSEMHQSFSQAVSVATSSSSSGSGGGGGFSGGGGGGGGGGGFGAG